MEIRTDRGWIKAGLAVLVTGVLGGGVLAAAGGSAPTRKVTADGVTGKLEPSPPAPNTGFDLSGVAPAGADEAPKKTDREVGEKVMVGDDGGSVTVSAVEDNVSAGRLFGAGEGNKYIAAEVKGCSGPNEKNISFEPAWFLLRLDDGTVHDPGVPAKKPSLDGGKVPPGKCLSGWVTFTVKEGALATAVIYDGSSRLTWTVPLPKNAKQTTTTTMKPGATTTSTDDADGPKATTSTSTKPKTTSTTAKSTATTARSSTGSTAKSTATTGKASSTSTTRKSSGSTTTTTGSASTSTTSSGGKSGTSSTTTPAKPSTTTTTGPIVGVGPADSDG